jgi:ribose 5-phosphate isomerase A
VSDLQKRIAGEAAAQRVEAGMVVGLGTGSTAAWFVKALAARDLQGLRCVPTSEATAELARELGLPLSTLEDTPRIDLTVDGADEIGPGLALIKGGGAALLREKLVWEASARCIVIADSAKVVKTLGAFALPIEVVAFGHKTTANRIADVLADHEIAMPARVRSAERGLVRTDGGNLIYDARCGVIHDPVRLADDLKLITGVVEHGLFLDLADEAIVGTDAGAETRLP